MAGRSSWSGCREFGDLGLGDVPERAGRATFAIQTERLSEERPIMSAFYDFALFGSRVLAEELLRRSAGGVSGYMAVLVGSISLEGDLGHGFPF